MKELRALKGLTQEEPVDRAELSKGFISQLERDLTSPSVATLMDILQCLGTAIGEFFDETPEEQIVFGKVDYFEKHGVELKNEIKWTIPNAQKNVMEPIMPTLEAGGETCPDNPHEGEEFGYILQGSVSIHIGNKIRRVKKGESFYFIPDKKHYLTSKTGATLLWVSSSSSFQHYHTFRRTYVIGQSLIDLVHITKNFDSDIVLDDLNLSVKENIFVTLLGSSGCGKTTTLRIIGGFKKADSGKVISDGQDIGNIPPNKRQLSTVFQKYALSPHMNIVENIVFSLKIKNEPKAYIDDEIKYALKLVSLFDFEKRSVDSLSGGQQQRIAIARVVVNEPKVPFFDEPLGTLDLKLCQDMQYESIRLKNEFDITLIYVTHDQEEALIVSDAIIVMNQGYIQRMGSPEQTYNEPENAFVADFIGESNTVPGIMIRDELVEIFGSRFACADKGFGNNKSMDVVIHPEDIDLIGPENGILKGVCIYPTFKGVHYGMEVITPDGYEWLAHNTDMCPVGQGVGVHMDPPDIQIMNKPASEDKKAVGASE